MSELLEDLRSLSYEELIKKHDALAENTQPGVKHYLTEIARRDQDRQTEAMIALTKGIKKLTLWIAIMTMASPKDTDPVEQALTP